MATTIIWRKKIVKDSNKTIMDGSMTPKYNSSYQVTTAQNRIGLLTVTLMG